MQIIGVCGYFTSRYDQIANPFKNVLVETTQIYNNAITWVNNTGHLALVVIDYTLYAGGYGVSMGIVNVKTMMKDVQPTQHNGHKIDRTTNMLIPNGATLSISYAETGYAGFYTIFGIS